LRKNLKIFLWTTVRMTKAWKCIVANFETVHDIIDRHGWRADIATEAYAGQIHQSHEISACKGIDVVYCMNCSLWSKRSVVKKLRLPCRGFVHEQEDIYAYGNWGLSLSRAHVYPPATQRSEGYDEC
jgi:hypothetical protein